MCLADFERDWFAERRGVYAVEGMGWSSFTACFSAVDEMES